jgi:F420H(2)-dependent quinone reductase
MVDRSKQAGTQKLFNTVFNAWFRFRKGKVGYKGAPACILHTTGAKSGRPRETPLLYLDVGDGRFALVGSNGGDDRDPAWVHNLRAHPQVDVEVEGQRRTMTAVVADDATRDELWPRLVAIYKQYANYQTKTDRKIPVIVLTGV